MEVVRRESKNKEDALEKILEELNVNLDEVFYSVKESQGSFGKTKYLVSVVTKYDVKVFIEDYLNKFLEKLGIKAEIGFKDVNGDLNVYIYSLDDDEASFLIGKQGKFLKSLQHVLRKTLKTQTGFGIKINLDIAGYRRHKEDMLKKEIRGIVKDVQKTKIDAKLDPMNSYDRRIVHMIVQEYDGVVTQSEGDEPNRYVVIKYKG